MIKGFLPWKGASIYKQQCARVCRTRIAKEWTKEADSWPTTREHVIMRRPLASSM